MEGSNDINHVIIMKLKEDPNCNQKDSLIKSIVKQYKKHQKHELTSEDKKIYKKKVKSALIQLVEQKVIIIEKTRNGDDDEITIIKLINDTNLINKKKRKNNEIEDDDKKNDDTDNNKESKLTNEYPAPPPIPLKDQVTILLFYAYCSKPMTNHQVNEAINYCKLKLNENDCTGRLRVAKEGFNATLTGSKDGIRAFTSSLANLDYNTFGDNKIDFKYVDGLPPNQKLKGLKVWAVNEIVTYGFDPKAAPLDKRGTHLPPEEFHKALEDPNAVVIDVRNFNETLIGKFAPPGDDPMKIGSSDGTQKVLDPCMRRSTEFPEWVDNNRHQLEGKKVLMYCTGGVRCERASAFMRNKGIQNVFQLEGGIHRYLDTFKEDGGHWVGKNYTFDRRYNHGADNVEVISKCVVCNEKWDRYQAKAKCAKRNCGMEVLLCRTCERGKKYQKADLRCPLCH